MPFPDMDERVVEARGRVAAAVGRGGHGQDVTLVAVTKTHGPAAVAAAWNAGIHDIGENRVQEALSKMEAVEVPVRWHLIGHLQRNKVRSLDQFALFHALDSQRLANAVDRFGRQRERAVDALLQVNVAGEDTKGGLAPDEVRSEAERLVGMSGVRICGVMTMAPYGASEGVLRATFGGAREAASILREVGHPAHQLSMGMSEDFEVAVEEGATIVRLGTYLFGARAR